MKNYSRNLIVGLTVSALTIPAGIAFANAASATTPLTSEQISLLQAMTAEEKLAGDVYDVLAATYPEYRSFSKIGQSEDKHLDRMRALLESYGITDPTVGDAAGEFDDPEVQQLFNDLVAQGTASIEGAAGVGISIEEMDIADLDEALAQEFPADVDRILTNLRAASENHLAAFESLAENPQAALTAHGKSQQHGKAMMGKAQGKKAKVSQAKNGRGQGKGKMNKMGSGMRQGKGAHR